VLAVCFRFSPYAIFSCFLEVLVVLLDPIAVLALPLGSLMLALVSLQLLLDAMKVCLVFSCVPRAVPFQPWHIPPGCPSWACLGVTLVLGWVADFD
jgi:hypothetical protein